MVDSMRVLIVDRERFSGLISRMLAGAYRTDTAADGLLAIQKLRKEVPDAIVVDQDVPGNGIRLAELVGMSPKYRGAAVILTSSAPTPDVIIRAKNAGISAYLAKPFRPSELISRIESSVSVRRAAETAEQTKSEPTGEAELPPESEPAKASKEEAKDEETGNSEIEERIRKIEGLPPFPATHAEIMKLAKSEESSSEDLAEKIQLDPGFLATVLKLANSSYYGFAKKTDSLTLAVTRLGMEEIGNLVMAAQVFEKLGGFQQGDGLDIQAFWKHSVGTAFVARAIAKKLQSEVDAAFLAGMLHDLGKVVLDRFFADYYQSVLQAVQEEGLTIAAAEVDVLGLSHAEVGGQLAKEWRFSSNYLNSILYHHHPRNARRYQRLVCMIHLADVLCREFKFGSGGDDLVPEMDESALDRFSLGDRGIQILREAAEADLENAESFLTGLAS